MGFVMRFFSKSFEFNLQSTSYISIYKKSYLVQAFNACKGLLTFAYAKFKFTLTGHEKDHSCKSSSV